MRVILSTLIEEYKGKSELRPKLISSRELAGHECKTLVFYLDEHDVADMSLSDAARKVNLLCFGVESVPPLTRQESQCNNCGKN